MLRIRLPYFIEEKFGFDMSYYIIVYSPNTLGKPRMRHSIKEDDIQDIKHQIFSGYARIDDPLDIYTCHTVIHDAITLNKLELLEFMLSSGANPDMRDQNGYTPLLKAASIGRTNLCQILIEAGVDPL